MDFEIYDRPGGMKLEKVIALERSVQWRMENWAERHRQKSQRRLNETQTREIGGEWARKQRRGRPPSKLYTSRGKVDHHVVLEGPVTNDISYRDRRGNRSTTRFILGANGGGVE